MFTSVITFSQTDFICLFWTYNVLSSQAGQLRAKIVDLPEGFQRAHPAAEVNPEQTEGTEAADGTRQKVPQRLPCPAPCPPDEGTHQGGEGG